MKNTINENVGYISSLNQKKQSGITLIALVITIVVLLILAGVTISTLTGQNGLLERTKNAKARTEYESAKETINLKIADANAKFLTENSRIPSVTELADYMSSEYQIDVEVIKYYYIEIATKLEGITLPETVKGFLVKATGYNQFSFLIGESCKIEKVSEDNGVTLKNINEFEKEYFGEKIENTEATEETPEEDQIVSTLLMHGNDMTDSSNANNVITSTNVEIVNNGKFGNCYDFTGDNAFINIGASKKYFLQTDNFTIDMWIYITKQVSGYGVLYSHGGSNSAYGFDMGFYIGTLKPFLYMGGHKYANQAKAFQMNTWQHVAFVKKDNTYSTYIDGILSESAILQYNYNGDYEVGFGYNQSYSPEQFYGYIDEIRITNSAVWDGNFDVPTREYRN